MIGIGPCHVGEIPDQLARLKRADITLQQLTVEAALRRDRGTACVTALRDPPTATVLEGTVDKIHGNRMAEPPRFQRPARSPLTT